MTLRRQQDFDRIFRQGKWHRQPEIAIGWFWRNDNEPPRVAFVAGRRIGGSVSRNRARRRMREAYRVYADRVSLGHDLVLLARDATGDVEFSRLQTAIERVLMDAELLETPIPNGMP